MVKYARICVDKEFKFALEMKRLEAERKENRKISLPDFTKKIDIIPRNLETNGWKEQKRKRNEWLF